MPNFLIRIYDYEIRTNYIEQIMQAEDQADALIKVLSNKDIQRESVGKFSTKDSISTIIDNGSYEITPL